VQPPQAGRGREVHLGRKLGIGQSAILLQGVEDLDIGIVERRHKIFFEQFFNTANIPPILSLALPLNREKLRQTNTILRIQATAARNNPEGHEKNAYRHTQVD